MFRIGVDVGGTFTDFVMFDTEGGSFAFHKVPSTPDDPSRAIATGISEMLAAHSIDPKDVGYLGHGTTVATNMVIERRGVPTGLMTTKGFRDVIAVGRQTRPALYDYGIRKPEPLVERYRRIEISERMDKDGAVLAELDVVAVEELVRQLVGSGVQAIAIGFLHSYRNPDHERMVRDIVARIAPEIYVSTSADVVPEFREFERISTTVLNAYVGPRTQRYLNRLRAKIAETGITVEPLTFHSNGGLLPVQTVEQLPVLTCLSGPAAGVMGSANIGAAIGQSEIITFDVGGTSTDVSLITKGKPQFTSSRLVAGYPVKMPMIDIHVIGAGGGSIAAVDDAGALKVGPNSAGAMPGPISYLRGGTQVTLTDANIVLGRLNPVALLEGRMKVDRAPAVAAIREQIAEPLGISVEEAAHGIIRIATANMSRAIRSVSIEHGYDLADFVLYAFGGAGPLHAADVAHECGLKTVVVPQEPGTLCARGILLSNISRDYVRTTLTTANAESWRTIAAMATEMSRAGLDWLKHEQVADENCSINLAIDARYRGQSHDIRVHLDGVREDELVSFVEAFHARHTEEYGYDISGRDIEIVNVRVQAVGFVPKGDATRLASGGNVEDALLETRDVYFGAGDGWQPARVYRRGGLPAGTLLEGPVVIEEMSGTTVVLPGQTATVDLIGNIHIKLRD